MEWIQITARTVDDAKEQALDRLGVHESDLEIEVLQEPRSGFLGVGRSDARIRAHVKPVSREKPDTRRRERGRSGRGKGRDRRPAEKPAAAAAPAERDRDSSHGGEPRRQRSTSRKPQERAVPEHEDEYEMTAEDLDEQCRAAADFASGLLDTLDLDGEVSTDADDGRISVSITGEGLSVLIGPNGATLTALEDVTHSVVQRATGGHSARIRVDVGGYREKRRAALEQFAREIADRVKESGDPQSFEPMSSSDRKIVHDVIADIDGVATTSEGVEPRRRVVVRPD